MREGQHGTVEEQIENIKLVSSPIVELIQEGFRIILIHGNAPQV
ncbi:MAG: carbamate kinase, partial [Clostridia bacterium]|nr:carbamate kinase [Clostridia bacterium]